jgi:hypothetical protein
MNHFHILVGLLGWRISSTQGLYLHRPAQHRETKTNIHASSGIWSPRSQRPSNQDLRLRPRDRMYQILLYILIRIWLNFHLVLFRELFLYACYPFPRHARSLVLVFGTCCLLWSVKETSPAIYQQNNLLWISRNCLELWKYTWPSRDDEEKNWNVKSKLLWRESLT